MKSRYPLERFFKAICLAKMLGNHLGKISKKNNFAKHKENPIDFFANFFGKILAKSWRTNFSLTFAQKCTRQKPKPRNQEIQLEKT